MNPYTPLAFLPPDLASQFEVSRYIYAVTLGVSHRPARFETWLSWPQGYLWDIAVNFNNDYKLIFVHTIRLPTVVYYLSR